MRKWTLHCKKTARMNIFKADKTHAHDHFSVCSLNTKSFYHDLIISLLDRAQI